MSTHRSVPALMSTQRSLGLRNTSNSWRRGPEQEVRRPRLQGVDKFYFASSHFMPQPETQVLANMEHDTEAG